MLGLLGHTNVGNQCVWMLSLSEGESSASEAFLLPVDIGAALEGEDTGGGTFLAAVAGTWRAELGEGYAVVATTDEVPPVARRSGWLKDGRRKR